MITKVFSVYDLKALVFGVPFFMPSVGGAVRAFADLASDGQSLVAKHPTDFVLFQIGEFDDSKGVLVALDKHIHLGIASDFLVKAAVDVSGDSRKAMAAKLAEEMSDRENGGSR